MAQTQSLSIPDSQHDYSLWERLCILRDRLIADTRFQNRVAKIPFLKNIAKKRANQLFDVMAGFVYTQILLSCVRLNLFNLLKDGPLDLADIKKSCSLDAIPLKKLLDAAVSIQLLEMRSQQRYGLGALGAQEQASNLARLQAQQGSAAQQQALTQTQLDTAYQDFLRQRDYPQEQLGFYSNILRGLPVQLASTSQTYQAPPSIGSQIGGLGLGALGLAKALG